MSKIDKLSIQGIRSFGTATRETIQFNTPLTLIVGQNGCGKTTIIECLKYATTGELPPNSKGGAFIHDPELAQSKEVLAQVKLSFSSASGSKYVVSRNLQLTVKKTTRSMKTLEGSLLVSQNGQRSVISTRVAQLDEAIPMYLGVSPAVLDSVIFCHQDESLWPLSEPAALKKKFDEIFEAQKYTKAIDNLKTLRKKKGEDLRVLKEREEHERANKVAAERTENEARDLQAAIEEDRVKAMAIVKELAETQEMVRELRSQAAALLTGVYDLQNKRRQLADNSRSAAELKSTIEVLEASTEDLERMMTGYEERLRGFDRVEEGLEKGLRKMRGEMDNLRMEQAGKFSLKGRLLSDKDKFEKSVDARMKIIKEAAGRFGFEGIVDEEVSESQVVGFCTWIGEIHGVKKREVESVKAVVYGEIDEARMAISALEQRKASLEQGRQAARVQIDRWEVQSAALFRRLRDVQGDEGDIPVLERKLEEAEEEVKTARNKLNEGDFDGRISREREVYGKLAAENTVLGTELAESSLLAEQRAQLTIRKGEIFHKKKGLASLANTWGEKLTGALGEWTVETVEEVYSKVLTGQEGKVAEAAKVREEVVGRCTKVEVSLRSARGALSTALGSSEGAEKKVVGYLKTVNPESTGIRDFPGELQHHEEKVEDCKAEIGLWDALAKYYGQCSRYLATKNSCKMCERPFDAAETAARARMEKKIRDKLNPKEKEESEAELIEAAGFLTGLRGVRVDYETWERLQGEIPGLKKEVERLEGELETVEEERLEAEVKVAEEEEGLKSLRGLGKAVSGISQVVREIDEGTKQVEKIDKAAGAEDRRGTEEIIEARGVCEAGMKAAKKREDDLVSEKQKCIGDLASLEMGVRDVRARLVEMRGIIERRGELERQMRALKEDITTQKKVIEEAEAELEVLEVKIVEAGETRDEVVRKGRAQERKAEEELEGVVSVVNALRPVEAEIKRYISEDGAGALNGCLHTLAQLEQRILEGEKNISVDVIKCESVKSDRVNSDQVRKNIADNLRYRAVLSQLDSLKEDIIALEEQGASTQHGDLEAAAEAEEKKAALLIAEKGAIMGSMKTRDAELTRKLELWELEYKHASTKHREARIKVETTKAAIEDLGRYGDALDKAIMQYHALKMRQVNETALDLWKATYRGDDIDYILVRSDAESATGKRSYNYRVTMSKHGTEMDMRGRCSAGQKVLASIIIRLALAESFGVNCGIIALDEPTTNLDADNARALAGSLHDLIGERQGQRNFQIVVITHDEEFLKSMRCGEFSDVFYRVKRDGRGRSVILRESILDVL